MPYFLNEMNIQLYSLYSAFSWTCEGIVALTYSILWLKCQKLSEKAQSTLGILLQIPIVWFSKVVNCISARFWSKIPQWIHTQWSNILRSLRLQLKLATLSYRDLCKILYSWSSQSQWFQCLRKSDLISCHWDYDRRTLSSPWSPYTSLIHVVSVVPSWASLSL